MSDERFRLYRLFLTHTAYGSDALLPAVNIPKRVADSYRPDKVPVLIFAAPSVLAAPDHRRESYIYPPQSDEDVDVTLSRILLREIRLGHMDPPHMVMIGSDVFTKSDYVDALQSYRAQLLSDSGDLGLSAAERQVDLHLSRLLLQDLQRTPAPMVFNLG